MFLVVCLLTAAVLLMMLRKSGKLEDRNAAFGCICITDDMGAASAAPFLCG
jgi:hypothetical protein